MLAILKPSKGKLLLSEPFMQDPNFKRSVVLLAVHDEEGSIGFILNQPTGLHLKDVMSPDFPNYDAKLYSGGPVGQDSIHYIHTIKDLENSIEIAPGIFYGGDFERLQEMMESDELDAIQIRFFIGYSGWGNGQLDQELKENSWLITEASQARAFNEDFADLWKSTVRDMGKRYEHIANFPENPIWN